MVAMKTVKMFLLLAIIIMLSSTLGYGGVTINTFPVGKNPPVSWTGPEAIAIDQSGNIWVATNDESVTKLSSTGARLGNYPVNLYPNHIVIDPLGKVWVAGNGPSTPSSGSQDLVVLNPAVTSAMYYDIGSSIGVYTNNGARAMAVDPSGYVWVVDGVDIINGCSNNGSHCFTNLVSKINPQGQKVNFDLSPANLSCLGGTSSVAFDASGNGWFVDTCNGTLTKLGSGGEYKLILNNWSNSASSNSKAGIAIDQSGNIWISDLAANVITKLSPTGANLGTFSLPSSSYDVLAGPIAIDSAGYIWIAGGTSIYKLDSTGNIVQTIQLSYLVSAGSATGIAIDISGNVWVTAYGSNDVAEIVGVATGPQYFPGSQSQCTYALSPSSYALNAAGNTGSLTVTPTSSSCAWTVSTTNPWITITSGSSGTGTGTVTYSVAANSGAARTGTMSIGGQTFTVTQDAWTYSNSIGARNSIKITDMSGSLPTSGAAITVAAWDATGKALALSASATPPTLLNYGTVTINGTNLTTWFTNGIPMSYSFTVASSKYIITNVKSSSDGTLNVPNGYTNGTMNFVANSVGPRNSIKITDMSGTLPTSGAAITVAAWDVSGKALTQSASATPPTLLNYRTVTINGTDLAAWFIGGTPISYSFTVPSSKYIITNVKSSTDGSINIPYSYPSGTTNFVANSIGPRNTIMISDVSGSLPTSGAAITVAAWDASGKALTLSASASPPTLLNYGTVTINGTSLAAWFTGGTPISYSFTVASSKYIITNVKSSTDGTINIPYVYYGGTTTYDSNDITSYSTIKITDVSGSLSTSGATITVAAWDASGKALTQSVSATPPRLLNYGTVTINGTNLAAWFTGGTPVLYEFTVGSSMYLITNVTSNTTGAISIPSVYSSGVAGGI
jgi:sugar lactone lactonase YvrE